MGEYKTHMGESAQLMIEMESIHGYLPTLSIMIWHYWSHALWLGNHLMSSWNNPKHRRHADLMSSSQALTSCLTSYPGIIHILQRWFDLMHWRSCNNLMQCCHILTSCLDLIHWCHASTSYIDVMPWPMLQPHTQMFHSLTSSHHLIHWHDTLTLRSYPMTTSKDLNDNIPWYHPTAS